MGHINNAIKYTITKSVNNTALSNRDCAAYSLIANVRGDINKNKILSLKKMNKIKETKKCYGKKIVKNNSKYVHIVTI